MTAPGAFPPHVRPDFRRHGGYPPRLGWLKKTYDGLCFDPYLFTRTPTTTTVVLGVGSSMVTALRYWSLAMKLAEPDPDLPRAALRPTGRGHWLLSEDGADPWLENPDSWGLLHWWLLAPPCIAPTWWWAFARWPFARIDRAGLVTAVSRAADATQWAARRHAVADDVSCLLRMYGPSSAVDDLDGSPMRTLGLLGRFPDPASPSRQVLRRTPPRLSSAVVAYTCLEWAHRRSAEPGSVALSTLRCEPDAPGRVFGLGGDALRAALVRSAEAHSHLAVTNSTGEDLLSFDRPPLAIARDLLDDHYYLDQPEHRP